MRLSSGPSDCKCIDISIKQLSRRKTLFILDQGYNGKMIDIGTVIVAVLFLQSMAINQTCPCPANSNCLSNNMCSCNQGFIGNCSTPAQPLSTQTINITLTQSSTPYFVVSPISLTNYIEFTINICVATDSDLTFYLWGETGNSDTYSSDTALGNPVSATVEGCQQLVSPYISFGTQPNGLSDQLIVGVLNTSPTTTATLSVTQQAVIGVFLYYYILIALIALVGVAIAIGIGVFVLRQRRRRRLGLGTSSIQPNYNEIEHFQNYMPMFQAERLGHLRSICPICLQQIEAAEVVRQPPCSHVYHSTCIDSWALKNLSCPVCRADLSMTALETARRVSIVRVSLPPQEDWEEQSEMPAQGGTTGVEKGSPARPPLLDEKYEIKENML